MRSNVFRPVPSGAHAQVSSTGTGDVQLIVAPALAQAALITVETTSCYITTDGTTPSSSAGILLPTGIVHFLPIGSGLTLKLAASAGTTSKVNVTWLT